MGLSPDPGFAHNKGEAKPNCELYFQSFGIHLPSPARPTARTEDALEEIGMCVEDGEVWTTYLRLPEIRGDVRMRALRGGSVQVDAGGTRNSISLMELRPGIGSARLVVPPVAVPYKVTPHGEWPLSISQAPWQGVARGLNPRGTPFRMRRGEWVRLKEGSAVELGEELLVVAESGNAPPHACSPEPRKTVLHNRLNWRMWRIELPAESTSSLDRWAENIDVILLEPAWKASILSVPNSFSSDEQVPILGTRSTLIGRLESPRDGGRTTISLRLGSASQAIPVATSNESTAFVAFSVPWPGSNELSAGNDSRSSFTFETATELTRAELQSALGEVPVLCVVIGENVIESWGSALEIPAPPKSEEPPEIFIRPDLDDLRLGLHWRGSEGNGSEEGLTAEATKNRLRSYWGKDVEVRVSGGALGTVKLRFRPARWKGVRPSDIRTLSWASLAVVERGRSGGAWMLRRAAALNPNLLKAARSRGDSRWMPLAVATVKEPGK